MAWFSRFTRFGDAHLVYGQEENMSCGIASIIMCVFKINKLSPGAGSLYAEKEIYDLYAKASGGAYKPETQGTHPVHLATVLNGLNCGTWTGAMVSGADAAKQIIDSVGISSGFGPTMNFSPVIAGVGWAGGGGHAVVIDTIRDFMGTKYATVCDPWDANVHIEEISAKKPFVYNAGKGGFHVNFWGDTKNETKSAYGATDQGKNIALIYRK